MCQVVPGRDARRLVQLRLVPYRPASGDHRQGRYRDGGRTGTDQACRPDDPTAPDRFPVRRLYESLRMGDQFVEQRLLESSHFSSCRSWAVGRAPGLEVECVPKGIARPVQPDAGHAGGHAKDPRGLERCETLQIHKVNQFTLVRGKTV